MAYGTFTSYEEVATRFKIKFVEIAFLQEQEFSIQEEMFNFIQYNLQLRRYHLNEYVIGESIIFPILSVIARQNDLPLWSHIRFDVTEQDGLIGIPDYIIAPASDIGTTFTRPVICIAEAKRDNFNEGWAQALAEMIAAQRFNQDEFMEIFGIVTTGNFWQFAKLQHDIFTMNTVAYSASDNLHKLLNTLHWVFNEARRNITKMPNMVN
jgi:hypothetical protein